MTTSKPTCENKSMMRCMVLVTGCTPPFEAFLPGNVTSTDSDINLAFNSATIKVFFLSWIAVNNCPLAWLIAAPADLRSSAGNWPNCFNCKVTVPFCPKYWTRTSSNAWTLWACSIWDNPSVTICCKSLTIFLYCMVDIFLFCIKKGISYSTDSSSNHSIQLS